MMGINVSTACRQHCLAVLPCSANALRRLVPWDGPMEQVGLPGLPQSDSA